MRNAHISCGCKKADAKNGSHAENLTGKVFGKLTVLYRTANRNGRTCWMCQCSCGRQKEVTAHDLKSGKVKSCGCLRNSSKSTYRDLTGMKIGRLSVIHPTNDRDHRGSVVWHCRCDCGNEVNLSEAQLIYGNYKSCGCLKQENQQKIYKTLHLVDGTCVEMLEKRKSRSDNSSGFRGVSKLKNGRYRVSIGFRGVRYHIGCFSNYDEAVNARVRAEAETHDKFVNQFRYWEEKAKVDPKWMEDHPFRFQMKEKQFVI